MFHVMFCVADKKSQREVRSFVKDESKQEVKARQKQRTLHDAVGASLWNIILLTELELELEIGEMWDEILWGRESNAKSKGDTQK